MSSFASSPVLRALASVSDRAAGRGMKEGTVGRPTSPTTAGRPDEELCAVVRLERRGPTDGAFSRVCVHFGRVSAVRWRIVSAGNPGDSKTSLI
ncbi:hypothetical protein K523DRAFT_126691 [Schizophyllum commune Tattone D]|nr:hypothetical protein K523DRAFT_126691 [Schizophyllum commune Tattone D]